MPDGTNDHYKSFDQLYGTETTEKYRPSLNQGEDREGLEENKKHIDVLKQAKVRGAVECAECDKPRLVYSMTTMNMDQMNAMQRVKDENSYRCGEALPCSLVARRSLTCESPIEIHYYSLQPVCYHCGSADDILDDFHEYIADLLQQFSKVRPICSHCHGKGLQAKTWGRKYFMAKKKR